MAEPWMGLGVVHRGEVIPGAADIPHYAGVAASFDTNAALSSIIGGTSGVGSTVGVPLNQSLCMYIDCHTRSGSNPPLGVTTLNPIAAGGSYSGGSTGFDGRGNINGTAILGTAFGTRSSIELRQDWLPFYMAGGGGAQHRMASNFVGADGSQSVAFYQIPYPWKIVQTAAASTATTGLTATFASPVAVGSRVVIVVACLNANSVVTPPNNAFFDGTIGETTARTSRVTAYRITTAMAGQTSRSVVMASTTGGAAMMMVELAQTDSLATALPAAIRAIPNYLCYYPLHHTLSTVEHSWGGTVGSVLNSYNQFTNYSLAGPDGRKYGVHPVANDPATLADANAWTPVTGGGLTIGFMVNVSSLAVTGSPIAKFSSGGGSREWTIDINTAGSVVAQTIVSPAGTVARSRTTPASVVAVNTWYLVIVRFGTTATAFPSDIRVNGTAYSGTTAGTGTAAGNTGTNVTVGGRVQSSATSALAGAMGHLWAVNGIMSTSDCQAIEAAAHADGWF